MRTDTNAVSTGLRTASDAVRIHCRDDRTFELYTVPKQHHFVYLFECTCGESIDVTAGQAGIQVVCESCETEHQLGSIRKLQKLPKIKRETITAPFQFRLKHIILSFIPFAVLSWLATLIGVEPIAALVMGVVLYFGGVWLMTVFIHHFWTAVGWCWDRFDGKH